jgi:hypothetical protein
MLLIWGLGQCRAPAAQWHDGQITHDTHARFARRANQTARPAVREPTNSEWSADARFGAHSGLKSDIA